MKSCIRCGQEKALDDFGKDKRAKDGRESACTACEKARKKAHWQANRERYCQKKVAHYHANAAMFREVNKVYYQEHKAERAAYERTRRRSPGAETRRIKANARAMVNQAVASGRLVREPCAVCGNERSHGHHDDYSKPLDVVWLCYRHHADVHLGKTIDELKAAAKCS